MTSQLSPKVPSIHQGIVETSKHQVFAQESTLYLQYLSMCRQKARKTTKVAKNTDNLVHNTAKAVINTANMSFRP